MTISISSVGAELQSIISNGREYLWQGDPAFWGRRAPILFPIVGRLADDTLRIDGREYIMKQHGFARDAEFIQRDGKYVLVEDGSRENYPYAFLLAAKYLVRGNTLVCDWNVTNRDNRTIYFQIGAHPAFLLPEYNINDETHGYIQFFNAKGDTIAPLLLNRLEEGLRVSFKPQSMVNDNNILALTNNTFANDAILVEGKQVASISLFDKQGMKVLTVSCPQSEAFSIWAPNRSGCPFVCIEPWCGIADRKGFDLDISKRDYCQNLEPGETFVYKYTITIENKKTIDYYGY